jgi:hypothetical protein
VPEGRYELTSFDFGFGLALLQRISFRSEKKDLAQGEVKYLEWHFDPQQNWPRLKVQREGKSLINHKEWALSETTVPDRSLRPQHEDQLIIDMRQYHSDRSDTNNSPVRLFSRT